MEDDAVEFSAFARLLEYEAYAVADVGDYARPAPGLPFDDFKRVYLWPDLVRLEQPNPLDAVALVGMLAPDRADAPEG